MKTLIVLPAVAALATGAPALANPDWTLTSPIKVTPSSIPDVDGTIVKMVAGAHSGPRTDAAQARCGCANTPAKPRLERRKS